MNNLEFRELLENDLLWRKEELNFMKGILNFIPQEEKKYVYRKSLILILYSHFEGFVKLGLLNYIKFLNTLDEKRKNFKDQLIVASMEELFKNYDNLEKKNGYFKKKFPEEKHLHKFCRRVDFIQGHQNFLEEKLKVPDKAINTESNLGMEVLEKNLYKLGIDYTIFSQHKNNVNKLVRIRNNIAHNGKSDEILERAYIELERCVLNIMEVIIMELYSLIESEEYLHSNS